MDAVTLAPEAALAVFDNLTVAYKLECTARVRYPAFAEEADREGYGPIASLFRAAARAEEIHAANHKAVIRSLGESVEPAIEVPIVKSTAENLQVAVEAETHERDVVYPAILAQARACQFEPAEKTFFLAKEVEAEHVREFTHALDNLPNLRGRNVTYYVCPVCGFMSSRLDFPDCAVCDGLAEDFVEVR